MLKKYYIAFFLLLYSLPAYSSVWDDMNRCLTDLCNCGSSPVDEIWNGKVKWPQVKLNPICAPWNKQAGRDTDNCLRQFKMPQPGIGFYLQHCAEKTADSTYFTPKIQIRTVTCNPLACWSNSTTLKYNGECAVWPGAFGVPALRICARVAMPKIPAGGLHQQEIPADDGYSVGTHLNEVGALEDDAQQRDEHGKILSFDRPKLCAYVDPGLVNLISATGVNTDVLDLYPYSQPLHRTDKLHPIIQVLLFFFKESVSNFPKMLGDLLDSIGAEKIPGLDVLEVILKQIGKLIALMKDLVEKALKEIGSLNKTVGECLGCVELPLGPFPPPYCPSLNFIIPSPTISTICSKKNPDGTFQQNSDDACVVSHLNNNIINNVVRISLDNLVPLCKNNQVDSKNPDKCVSIPPVSPSAKDIHAKTKQLDTIKPCPDTGSSGYCVDTKISLKCSVTTTSASCKEGFRIVYGQKIGESKTLRPYDYYVDDLKDCNPSGNNETACQEVWGINTGEFIDIALAFPEIQDHTNLLPSPKTITLNDNRNVGPSSRTFNVKIQLDAKSICVTEDFGELVGCVNRVLDGYVMKTYACDNSPSPKIQCTGSNSYFTPEFIAALEVLDKDDKTINSTSTVVAPLTAIPTPPPGTIEKLIRLAGLSFSSFMSFLSEDESEYIAMPFSGPNALTPLTRFGQYKDNKIPYDLKTKKLIAAGDYLTGLEYRNGQYVQGGTHACLQPQDMIKCTPGAYPSDPNGSPNTQDANCVLTQILEADVVDCNDFTTKIMQRYPTLRICRQSQGEGKNQPGCQAEPPIDGQKQVNSVTIYKCSGSVVCYENNIHPEKEVCKISVAARDRIIPDPSLGLIINQENQHFILINDKHGMSYIDKDGKLRYYDNKTQVIRDKTPLESGLCVKYPVPKCAAITTPTNNSGNATWPETEIGKVATGTCPAGFVSKTPLQRYCLSKVEQKSVEFEELAKGTAGCIAGQPQGLELKVTTTGFTQVFPHKEEYDIATKIGTILIGDHDGAKNISLLSPQNCINYEFNPSINKLEYFTIGDNANNFYHGISLTIKVNDKIVYSQTNDIAQAEIAIRGISTIDIIPHLINGQNNIKICIAGYGVGSSKDLKLTMKYKLK